VAWTPDEERDSAQFNARLKPHLNQSRQLGIHYYDEVNPVEIAGRPSRTRLPAEVPANAALEWLKLVKPSGDEVSLDSVHNSIKVKESAVP
jgi:N-acetyl-beta-hexosaminidase